MINLHKSPSVPRLDSADDSEHMGLPLVDDVEKRRKLALERRKDYNDFLARQKAYEEEQRHLDIRRRARRRKKKQKRGEDEEEEDEDGGPYSELPPLNDQPTNHVQALDYDSLLRQKKAEESKYREINGIEDPETSEIARLHREIAKLREERQEFNKLELSTVNTPVLSSQINRGRASNNSSFIPHQPLAEIQNSGIRQLPEPQNWERSQSLDRGMKGRSTYNPNFQDDTSRTRPFGKGISGSYPSTSVPIYSFGETNSAPERPRNRFKSREEYLKELEEQIQENKQRKLHERHEQERLEKKYQQEVYDPWGKGGAGAPMRDLEGNVVASRKPKFVGEIVHPVITSSSIMPTKARSDSSLNKEMPIPSRFRMHFSPVKKKKPVMVKPIMSMSKYREELEKQIHEKKRREEKQRELEKLEEEKLSQRIDEQRKLMLKEYEDEKEKKKKKEEEMQKKQERLVKLQEEKRLEAERLRQEELRRREKKRKENLENLNIINENKVVEYEPTIPALRTQTAVVEKLPAKSERFRKRSESRDRLMSNVNLLRNQLANETKDVQVKKHAKRNYVIAEPKRNTDRALWSLPI